MPSSHHRRLVPRAPCLVVDPDSITEEGRTVLVDAKGECFTCDIKPLGSNSSFSLTWKGWILSWNLNDARTFLYDPLSSEEIDLPHFAHHQLPSRFVCALSEKPTSNGRGCIVVILHPDKPCLWYCRVGGDEWIKYDYDVGSQPADPACLTWEKTVISSLTSCKGKFYYPVSGVRLAVIEFNPSPATHVVRMGGMPRGYWARDCYFELDEEPYQFYAFMDDSSIITGFTLYKIDTVSQRFTKVDEIGDRALLWSGHNGRCCPASRFGLEPNSVYWISPEDDSSIHIFNIVESTERVCDHPSKDLPKLSSKAFWLLPAN